MSIHQVKTFTNGIADVLPNQIEAARLADMMFLQTGTSDIFEWYHQHLDQNEYIQHMWDPAGTPSDNIFEMVKFCIAIMIIYVNVYEGGEGITLFQIMDDIETYHSALLMLYDECGIEWDLWG